MWPSLPNLTFLPLFRTTSCGGEQRLSFAFRSVLAVPFRRRCSCVVVVADDYAVARFTSLRKQRYERMNMVFSAEQVSGGSRWPLVRISVGGTCEVVSLSGRFLPLSVHWIGQSVVCPGSDCELCELLPIRGLFFLPVMCMGRTSILELASQSSAHLEMHCKLLHGGLQPGLVIRLSRSGRKVPIHSEVIDRRSGVALVPATVLASRVAALFHLPPIGVDQTIEDYELRLMSMVRNRNKIIAARMRAGKKGVELQVD